MLKAYLFGILCLLFSFQVNSEVIILADEVFEIREMDIEEVRKIFLLDINDLNNKKITVISFPKKSREFTDFVYDIYGFSTYQYNKSIERKIYSGKVKTPIIVATEEEMIHKIGSTPYSLGYLIDDDEYFIAEEGDKIVRIRISDEN